MLLNEATENIDSFIDTLEQKFPKVSEFRDILFDFIEKSECKKIELASMKIPAGGVALHNGVIINSNSLSRSLEFVIFLIFHEIAHQYQFKKYGADKMYELYLGDMSLSEAADFMKKTELVADEFAARKVRQLQKMGFLKRNYNPPQYYKNVNASQLSMLIDNFRNTFKEKGVKNPEQVSTTIYNMCKAEIEG